MEDQKIAIIGYAEIIQETQRFINEHWLAVSSLSLLTAIMQFIQAGGIGKVTPELYQILEITLDLLRILLVLLVIGNGSFGAGFGKIAAIFRAKMGDWKGLWKQLITNIAWNKITLSVNLVVFMVAMTIANASIALATHLGMAWLKTNELIAANMPHWPVVVFLQNLSTTPFTVVFVCILGLTLVGKNSTI